MKPAVVAVFTELPGLTGGAQVRNYYVLRALAQHYSVHAVCIVRPNETDAMTALSSSLGVTITPVSPVTRNIIRTAKTVIFNRLQPFLGDMAASGLGQATHKAVEHVQPVAIWFAQPSAWHSVGKYRRDSWRSAGIYLILDAHNIEAEVIAQGSHALPPLQAIAASYIFSHYRRYEQAIARSADLLVACSANDRAYFQRCGARTILIPNGVDVARFDPTTKVTPYQLLYMGGVGYPPNADAVKYYLTQIHPLVLRTVPQAQIILTGGAAPAWLSTLARTTGGVELAGFVADPRTLISSTAVCICPLRLGSGTRLKVLEYAGAGRAIVSSSKGAEGIDYQAGSDIIIADSPTEFASEIIRLINDQAAAAQLGANARKLAVRYDWQTITSPLSDLEKLCKGSRS